MNDDLPTTCVRCGKSAVISTAETIRWLDEHGPGKCEEKRDVE